MGLINDPDMCPECDTRNCQHPRHHQQQTTTNEN